MAKPSGVAAKPLAAENEHQVLFWGCFVALITTAFAFVGRLSLLGVWKAQFGLDEAELGRLGGIGIWPFAVSIIFFSLVIDRIGYKVAMYIAFLGHLIWTVMAVSAYFATDKQTGYQLLYWGSLICALANGTVEAFANPVVATLFSREKTKWLNILHAGWPGGLVVTGLLLIGIDTFAPTTPWWVKVGLIGIPTVIYFLMLVGQKFPESERVSAGVSYKEMLAEFGIGGAAVVAFLTVLQLIDFFSPVGPAVKYAFWGAGIAFVVAFGAYTKSIGRPLLILLIFVMMPLATTEIGTDGWISTIMEGIAKEQGFHAGWILVYTSAIMLVLRFFAGPIVHKISPLGLLAASAVLAIAGLFYLSFAQGTAIFIAATLYGFGKTFFWPTTLGVVAEQFPKGGALTLNAIAGIGMLAVGTLGFPYIGTLQTQAQQAAIVDNTKLQEDVPGLVSDGKVVPVVEKRIYEVLSYKTIDDAKLGEIIDQLPEDRRAAAKEEVAKVRENSNQHALKAMSYFPMFMLVCYMGIIAYFTTKGGYKPVELHGAHTGEDEGAVEY
ncbi:sugar MFS transporter [Anatilimnocola sp. NA78]|uniref:MFS transporter n=1 Tax=Anatilimnocola sp. NA78 TaxID=3415683 RepID=UPI003CE51737